MMKRLLYIAMVFSCFGMMPVIHAQRAEFLGDKIVLNGETISGISRYIANGAGDIMSASGTTVPSDGSDGYAKGCLFTDTDVATGISGLYENIGTNSSCKFRPVSDTYLSIDSQTAIATSGTTTVYTTVPKSCTLTGVKFASANGIGSSATKYYGWQITNLGQSGAGTDTLLQIGANTTISAGLGTNTPSSMTLTGTSASLVLTQGDRLKLDAGAVGTPTNTLTHPTWILLLGTP